MLLGVAAYARRIATEASNFFSHICIFFVDLTLFCVDCGHICYFYRP